MNNNTFISFNLFKYFEGAIPEFCSNNTQLSKCIAIKIRLAFHLKFDTELEWQA